MEELGLNVRWRSLLSEARERLRREALGGRIWGFEGSRIEQDQRMQESEEEREDWKKSWRRTQGSASRGRVKGIAQAFEVPDEVAVRSQRSSRIFLPESPHQRSDSVESTMSTASIDSGSSVDYERRGEGEYQGKIGSHDVEARPYERVRVASDARAGSRMGVRELVEWTAAEGGEKEVEGTLRGGSAGRSTLESLFGIEIGSARREGRTEGELEKELETERDLEEDILAMQVGGKKGSMVLVKRSQLEDLQRRMEEYVPASSA